MKTIYATKLNLKISRKMQNSINRIEKKYGKLDKLFGSEETPYNKKFYCYVLLSSNILESLNVLILHNGHIWKR